MVRSGPAQRTSRSGGPARATNAVAAKGREAGRRRGIIDRAGPVCECENMSTQFATAADGVRLAFERAGEGAGVPVVLVHGFGSSREQNWKSTGWYAALADAGYAVVAMDCRGHGMSDKPHDEASYGHERMAEDVIAVMDAAGFGPAHLVGYSMGGFIGIRLAARFETRVRSLSLGGVGGHYLTGPRMCRRKRSRRVISAGLLAGGQGRRDVTDPMARMLARLRRSAGARTALRWLPACARCRRLCRLRFCRNCRRRCWWSVARKIISPDRQPRWRRLSRMAFPWRFRGAITCRRWATAKPARQCWISSKPDLCGGGAATSFAPVRFLFSRLSFADYCSAAVLIRVRIMMRYSVYGYIPCPN